jgi:hypothetical protein
LHIRSTSAGLLPIRALSAILAAAPARLIDEQRDDAHSVRVTGLRYRHCRNMPSASSLARSLAGSLVAVLVLSAPGAAATPGDGDIAWRFPRLVAVKCGERECGTMVISRYHYFRDGDPTPAYERYGAIIRGRFRPVAGSAVEFRYLQVLTHFKGDDFRWARDPSVPLPVRYVDPPPFGTRQLQSDKQGEFRDADHAFDALPWFDEEDFPTYVDQPRAFLASARRHGAVSMQFETWLVCVIASQPGPDPDSVSDDRYEVAGLLGWQWGYDIAYRDIGLVGVDQLEDYTYTLRPLQFVTTPSEDFKVGMGTVMGDKVTDGFHIRFGDSARCVDRER